MKNKIIELEENDKKDLIKEFNIKGYLLEDKVIEVLSNHIESDRIHKNSIGIEYGIRNKGERVEIDAVVKVRGKVLIIEAKRSKYDWIFAPSLHQQTDLVNLIYISPKNGHVVKKMKVDTDFPIKMLYHVFEAGFEGDKLFRASQNKLSLPDKRRPVHDAIRQVLKESKAALLEKGKFSIDENNFVIPIIVTNARLLSLDYSQKNINEKGDLIDFDNLKEIGAVGINFNEYFGFNNEYGLSSAIVEEITKTVFIVNIGHLKEIVEYISKLRPGRYFGEPFFIANEDLVLEPFEE